jgi:hypothetical protein
MKELVIELEKILNKRFRSNTLNNLIPKLIHNKYISEEWQTLFQDVTLFMDISGFSKMMSKPPTSPAIYGS